VSAGTDATGDSSGLAKDTEVVAACPGAQAVTHGLRSRRQRRAHGP